MDRESFLNRIARQLKHPRGQTPPKLDELSPAEIAGKSESVTPIQVADLIRNFKTELEALGGTVYLEESPELATRRLKGIIQELNRIHGVDERVSTANLRWGTQVVFETLRKLCC